MWITWKQRDTNLTWPITIEEKIDIFYQQTLGWQLHVADLIANGGFSLEGGSHVPIRHSGFAVLQICLSYFETIGRYRKLAPGGSKDFFKAGVKAVLPFLNDIPAVEVDTLLNLLYAAARCGLYHNSRTCRGVGLGQPASGRSIDYDPTAHVLSISPERLPRDLKNHLDAYRAELLDPDHNDSRQHFEQQFDADFGQS